MMKRNGFLVAGGGILLGAVVGTVVTARPLRADGDVDGAGRGFDERSVEGSWGFATEVGYLLPPAVPEATPTVGIGRIRFDGEGGCSVRNIVNIAGEKAQFDSASCTYSVGPDGFGQAEAVFPTSPIKEPLPVSFVILDRGRELRFINTKFLVSGFTARRQ